MLPRCHPVAHCRLCRDENSHRCFRCPHRWHRPYLTAFYVFAEGTGVKESQLQGKVGAKGEAAGEVCHFDLLELLFGAPREQTAPIPLLVLEGLKGGKLASIPLANPITLTLSEVGGPRNWAADWAAPFSPSPSLSLSHRLTGVPALRAKLALV